MPTLCLSMIVKNESKILSRLLDSVVDHIDAYCICDTGSTDGTVELIQTYFEKYPHLQDKGKILEEPFQDFSYNRNVALQGCVGLSDYVLLLDADMILEWKALDKDSLTKGDAFTILQGGPGFKYRNTRIVRNSGLFNYRGATHEYIDCPPGTITVALTEEDIFVSDVGDGGSKGNKVERDIRLLKTSIEKEPNNERHYFYLANTYFDSGSLEQAEEMYRKRIAMGGWFQEIWYSWFRIGHLAMKQEKPDKALASWLEAYEIDPRRVENLYEMVKYYRVAGKKKLGTFFYEKAKDIVASLSEQDKSEFLFLHNDIYTHKLAYEWTILAYYQGVRDIQKEWVRVLKHGSEYSLMGSLISNMNFYDFTIPIQYKVENNMSVIHQGIRFQSSSPCLLKNEKEEGYQMNIRFVNYAYDKSTGFFLPHPESIVTLNALSSLHSDLSPSSMKFLPLTISDPPRLYHGVEDVRIFQFPSGDLHFMGTGYHQNNKLGVVTGKYPEDLDSPRELYQNFNPSDCEKNWVFVHPKNEENPLIVYRWHPIELCHYPENKLENEIFVARTIPTPSLFSMLRGSSNGFHYENQMWFMVHFVQYTRPRKYFHMLLVFDENMTQIQHVSSPFTFEKIIVEYCLSLVVEKDRLLLSYSTWDDSSKIAVVDKSSLPLHDWTLI
uniref:Glycosyltransferase 2-like domain-containing protein n=1 Tax=viral metagenome TaxID=1070528 RepID=A0A6C0IE22_9ZZZZ